MLSDFIARRIATIFHFYCDHHTDQHFSITAFYFGTSRSLPLTSVTAISFPIWTIQRVLSLFESNQRVNLRARHLFFHCFHTFVAYEHVDLNANSLFFTFDIAIQFP